MSVQHRVIHILRTIHSKLRARALRFLGINELVTHNLLVGPAVDIPVGEAFQRLMDRICILESHVNWRLYGLPAAVGNIKLEQTGILANSLELEQLIAKLAPTLSHPNERELARAAGIDFVQSSLLVASYGTQADVQNADCVLDVEDLFLPAYEAGFKTSTGRKFHAPTLSVLAATPTHHYQAIWLSNVCERVHPLKALLILKHAVRATKTNGIVAGYLSNETHDPRIAKIFDPTILNQLKIDGIIVELKPDGLYVVKRA